MMLLIILLPFCCVYRVIHLFCSLLVLPSPFSLLHFVKPWSSPLCNAMMLLLSFIELFHYHSVVPVWRSISSVPSWSCHPSSCKVVSQLISSLTKCYELICNLEKQLEKMKDNTDGSDSCDNESNKNNRTKALENALSAAYKKLEKFSA